MASLQTSGLIFSSSSSKGKINAAISVPKLPKIHFPVPKAPSRKLILEDSFTNGNTIGIGIPVEKKTIINDEATTAKLYAILEAVADRVEMHKNIGEQRDNWNKLILNSINMITLTATTMAGIASDAGVPLKISSTLLFTAATGMLLIVNKIQPSQLAEEQRNATRLFKQLYSSIQTTLALHDPNEMDVKNAMEKVLALDKAYPLPLLGKMIDKFPERFEGAVWWTKSQSQSQSQKRHNNININNGWSKEVEMEMREVIEVIKGKDSEEFMRLGNLALKINKILAISGPLLTAIAAAGSANGSSWAAIVAVTAGALATTTNTIQHAGQVGMVVEMYRNCAGFFSLLEESIQSTLEEQTHFKTTQDTEIFQIKLALQLGRSLSELRDLAKNSSSSRIKQIDIDEFASKLF